MRRSALAALGFVIIAGALGDQSLLAVVRGFGHPAPDMARRPRTTASAGTHVSVTLYSDTITVTTTARSVKAELRDSLDAPARAIGYVHRNEYETEAVLLLEPLVESSGGEAAAVRAGDVVYIEPKGEAPIVAAVPGLAADIDPSRNVIVCTAPPNSALDLALRRHDSPDMVELAASTDGNGRLNLDLDGHVDMRHGGSGSVTLIDDNSNRFIISMATLAVDIRLDVPLVHGRASLGSRVTVYVENEQNQRTTTDFWEGVPIPDGCRQDEWSVHRNTQWCGAIAPVAVGSTVVVERLSPVEGISEVVRTKVPELSIAMARLGTTVSGRAPARHVLSVAVSSPTNETYRGQVVADDGGAYSVEFVEAGAFDYRWRATVRDELDYRTAVSAVTALGLVRFEAYKTTVSGTAPEGQPVTTTLTSSTGAGVFRAVALAGSNGSWKTVLGPLQPVEYPHLPQRLLPGSSVEIAFVAGDPKLFRIPAVTVKLDEARDSVVGSAPAFAELRVRVGRGPAAPVVAATADAAGHYSAVVPPQVTRPVVEVTVELVDHDGTEYAFEWGPFGLDVLLGSPTIQGVGSPGHDVTAELLDDANRRVASAMTYVTDQEFGNPWLAPLEDGGGHDVIPRPGDRLSVKMDDETLSTTVPPVVARIEPSEDVVVGEGVPPFVEVAVIIGHGIRSGAGTKRVRSDGEGRFRADFAGQLDVAWNDKATVSFWVAGVRFTKNIEAGGLTVRLNEGIVAGSYEAGTRLSGQVRRRGAQIWYGETAPDSFGHFEMLVSDASDDAMAIQPGDQVVVGAVEHPTATWVLDVPPFTIDVDPVLNKVSGTAPSGSYLRISRYSGFPPQPSVDWSSFAADEVRQTVDSNGDFVVVWPRVVDIGPGDNTTVECSLSSGHTLVLTNYQPLVNVPVRGSEVCGYGNIGGRVRVEATSSDGNIGVGTAVIGRQNVFQFGLHDSHGAPIPVFAGDTVSSTVAGTTMTRVMPSVNAEVDWAAGRIRGSGPPLTGITISNPVTECLSGSAFAIINLSYTALSTEMYKVRAVTDEKGRFEADIQRFRRGAGDGVALGFFTGDGYRIYTQIFRPRIEAHVRTALVEGQVSPHRQVEILVSTADGSRKGACSTDGDARGRFECRAELDGQAIQLVPSDVISLTTEGTLTEMTVEALDFDMSDRDGVFGTTEPNREVSIRIGVDGSYDAGVFRRQSDQAGRFAFGSADIPPRSAWKIADISRLRIELPTASGHITVAEWDASPVSRQFLLFHPFALQRN